MPDAIYPADRSRSVAPRRLSLCCVLAAVALLLVGAGCRRGGGAPVAGEPTGPTTDTAVAASHLATTITQVHDKYPETPHQDVATVLAWQTDAQPWVAVDARTDAERAISTLPGAIPLADVLAAPDTYRDRRLVVYCTVGYRSADATDALRAADLQAWNLDGGITAWAHAGQPVVAPDGSPTRRIHTYSRAWNQLPPTYTPVW